jgi:hypothetical protein
MYLRRGYNTAGNAIVSVTIAILQKSSGTVHNLQKPGVQHNKYILMKTKIDLLQDKVKQAQTVVGQSGLKVSIKKENSPQGKGFIS